jgi:DNA-binding LacI/PurR family transcriptional regulator
MGYVPSRSARELAGRKSWTIGVCLAKLNDQVLAEQVKGLDDGAREQGWLLVALSHHQEQRERECVQDFQERRVDGIVVLGSAASRGYLDSHPGNFIPIVVANADEPSKDSGYRLGRQAFGRLLQLIQPG